MRAERGKNLRFANMESLRRSSASLRCRCLFLTCKYNPSEGVWHLSDAGVYLYLKLIYEYRPNSKGNSPTLLKNEE